MNNPDTLATLGTQDIGPSEQKNKKTKENSKKRRRKKVPPPPHTKKFNKMSSTNPSKTGDDCKCSRRVSSSRLIIILMYVYR